MIRVSVIIPTFNAAQTIERAINSVLSQAGNDERQIIVVDDYSQDDTVGIVLRLKRSQITLIRQNVNRGPASARNLGLSQASGDYVAFLDADDYWKPNFLQKCIGFLDLHPELVAVSVGQIHKIFGKPTITIPDFIADSIAPPQPFVIQNFYEFWGKHRHVCTGSVLMRMDQAKAIGGQREDLRVCEDLEFWAVLAAHGKWGFIPEVLFVSDGDNIITTQEAYVKDSARLLSIRNIHEWGSRLRMHISDREWRACSPILNRITETGTLGLLRLGRIREARENMRHYIVTEGEKLPWALRATRLGAAGWFCFAWIYLAYRRVRGWRIQR